MMEVAEPFPSELVAVYDLSDDDADDAKLAERLQLQEVLIYSSSQPTRPGSNSGGERTAGADASRSEPRCAICKQWITAGDALGGLRCHHSLCIKCLNWHIDGELRRNNPVIRCPRDRCDVALEPGFCRELLPPKLFDRWTRTLQHEPPITLSGTSRKSVVSDRRSRRKRPRLAPGHDPAILDVIEVSDEDPDAMRLIKRRRSVREVGEPSGVRRNAEEFYCNICMEQKPLGERFTIAACLHNFCTSCISNHIATKVEENVTSIWCPDPECKNGILEPGICKQILPQVVFDRWGLALCESAVGTMKFYCPYKDCSALLIDDGRNEEGQAITQAECPHCYRIFCALCKVPWHEGITCEGFQKLGEDERGKDDLLVMKLAAEKKWQRCPQCKMYVERRDGCMFMACRCGFSFCYVCAHPMSKATHYCKKCRR